MEADRFYDEKKTHITDDEGRHWTVILTDEKVKNNPPTN